MQHAAIRIEYDGAPFRGWARQPDQPTVEGEIRRACSELGLAISLLRVAGRTDSGVHATGQVASLAYDGPVPPVQLARAITSHLPETIVVHEAVSVGPDFDARGDARWREYTYRILARPTPSPLRAAHSLHHPRSLDLDRMQEAAAALVGQHDFTAFTPTDTEHVFFHRTVISSSWEQDGDEFIYRIRANAFLRNMVRITVGALLAVGRGEWDVERLRVLLAGAPRSEAHTTAPAHPLCLVAVGYECDPFATAHRS
jgi:tRNA pseudouridine38-40 synthase